MKISTIMVCRNAETTIGGAIESFLTQGYRDKELVVVDGASTDQTCAIVQGFASSEISLVSEPDGGIYDAMNKGLMRFQGDAFGFLNADDRYHDSSALERIASALGAHDMASGHLRFVETHNDTCAARVWRATPFSPGAFARGWAPSHPGTYARRSVFDRVGFFDDAYQSAGDYDWMLRALELEGVSFGVIDATLVDMALGGVSTSGLAARITNAREMLQARRNRLNSGLLDRAAIMGPLRKSRQLLDPYLETSR